MSDIAQILIPLKMETSTLKPAAEQANNEATDLLKAAKANAAKVRTKGSPKGKGKESKADAKKPATPKEKKVTMASELDKIILSGGDFDKLIEAATARSKKLGGTIKYNAGVIRAHIKYRENKNPKYLGNLKLTDKGIFAKTSKKAA